MCENSSRSDLMLANYGKSESLRVESSVGRLWPTTGCGDYSYSTDVELCVTVRAEMWSLWSNDTKNNSCSAVSKPNTRHGRKECTKFRDDRTQLICAELVSAISGQKFHQRNFPLIFRIWFSLRRTSKIYYGR
jgi:hypothetical protein